MRRTRLVLLTAAFAALPVAAQQRGMYGGISTGQLVGSINSAGFASGLGATVSALPQTGRQIPIQRGVFSSPGAVYGRGGGQGGFGGRGGRTVVVPYGMPMVYGGGYAGYDTAGPPAMVEPAPNPSVIINQYYTPDVVRPQVKEYDNLPEPVHPPHTEAEPPAQARVFPPAAREPHRRVEHSPEVTEAATKATITLLAFRDSSVITAIAYWVQGDRLHYVTKTFVKKDVPLNSLDKSTTELLNRERNVEFTLE